ncbi:asparagine synthase (glutamine-hydrolyzing) [Telmatospirillum siberiense]|uniref:asparagine synthase (glutamine-hydrolyzing) n=1 Tax=Telmatospirillum siberiense TaxID=382514 RepID=A0A2N3PVN1_9PROT|nr:asparagine synthase (glutamine-hydrolyzing) [Telmatospirillum siberiense]PKU24459.1 asparagine synthase (glutamine-hydrolyzing) [Telmatospirillum siberiense]
MCGIVAIMAYGLNASPVAAQEIIRIRDRMLTRGPDAGGCWLSGDGRVGLGHRRLAIIDLSPRGNQPMVLPDSGTSITFNGEIYNYRELRLELEQRGRVFRSECDTEVLLHAYEEYGQQMVHRLRGMYAFAIWDPRRRGLFLARDPFGIKPLYYADDGKRVVVSSQVKALLAADGIDREPDPAGKVSFLLWGFIMEPFTLYKSIHALPAGSTMWVDTEGAHPSVRFWSAADVFRDAEAGRSVSAVKFQRPEVVRDYLYEVLSESLRSHMIADVPVGVFLSGGLDSATLVGLASEQGIGDLRTLTLGFDELKGTNADEVGHAERIASEFHTSHQSHWIGIEQFAEERHGLLAAMDQPSVDGANVYFVSKAAAGAGLKVALSGLGGDELFGSYPSFHQIPPIVHWLSPFGNTPELGRVFRRLSGPLLRQFTSPKYASLFEYGTSVEDAYLLRRGLFLPWELPGILDPEEVREGWEKLSLSARLHDCTKGVSGPRTKVAALEMAIYMRNQLLRDSDWAGMAHSVEIRVPFVDQTLLTQLAPLLIGPSPLSKRDMVSILRNPLPDSVLNRPKTGFNAPIREWIAKGEMIDCGASERGLRGWARYILREQLASVPSYPISVPVPVPAHSV